MQLKNYQQNAINILDFFCHELNKNRPIDAFKNAQKKFNQKYDNYLEIEEFDKPYVCIRVPTGGGKTLIATKSIRILVNEFLNRDYHLIFWLAPTDTIVKQTIQALKNKQHQYRKILDLEFDNIKVLSIKEALSGNFDIDEELVIIVATIQSFRTNSSDGRKFYEERGVLDSLEKSIQKAKPLIILDEAHKSSTSLSLKSLINLNPSFILELSATPIMQTNKTKGVFKSNVLYSVSATELKRESMIKLPIMLKTVNDYMEVLKDSISKQKYLEKIANLEEFESGEYIRPIVLIRAEENRNDSSINFSEVKKLLIDYFKINEEEIAIQTGDKREIDNIDLKSKDCKIRYIITVDALKEGWDCPFAYILASLSNMKSNTSIEQLIGRVLRMPNIKEKKYKELNYSYCYVVSNSFEDVANSIGNTLKDNGFEEFEAKVSINNSNNSNENIDELGGLFADNLYETMQIQLDKEFDFEKIDKSIEPYINYNSENNKLTILKIPTTSKRESFKSKLQEIIPQKADEIENIINSIEKANPAIKDKIVDFELPKLMVKDGNIEDFFEESFILENINIRDSDLIKNANLTIDEFDIEIHEEFAKIDIKNDKLHIERVLNQNELDLYPNERIALEDIYKNQKILNENGQEIAKKLTHDISNKISHEFNINNYINSYQLRVFITSIIMNLIKDREISIYLLESKKFELKKSILKKLKNLIDEFKNRTFDSLLNEKRFFFNENYTFKFTPDKYKPNVDEKSCNFKKHFYKCTDKFDSLEEFEVAKFIDDKIPKVTTWIKNISNDPINSFWLQTANGKFYPDFIIKLDNGKVVVAEYKGEHLKSNIDTIEKEKIGKIWSSINPNFEFLMVYNNDYKEKLKSY